METLIKLIGGLFPLSHALLFLLHSLSLYLCLRNCICLFLYATEVSSDSAEEVTSTQMITKYQTQHPAHTGPQYLVSIILVNGKMRQSTFTANTDGRR